MAQIPPEQQKQLDIVVSGFIGALQRSNEGVDALRLELQLFGRTPEALHAEEIAEAAVDRAKRRNP